MVHINLSPHNHRFTPEMLAESLANLRDQQGRFICPETEPGRLIERMLFDPNRCDCLRYDRLTSLGGTWHRAETPPNTHLVVRSCLFGKIADRLGPLTKTQIQQQQSNHRRRKLTTERKVALDTECMTQPDAITVCAFNPLDLDAIGPQSRDRVTALPCRGGGLCLQLNFTRVLELGSGPSRWPHLLPVPTTVRTSSPRSSPPPSTPASPSPPQPRPPPSLSSA
ncbi:hypothetical protein B0T21DRAFT_198527 [Apiosordaria backusii]|uniref:Uncharacterized protein n=1 Tax=Apiosordaria backusii TaxID=314023 RepID=A0AA40BEB1_9PEZI|nr:hypothetical protein B0T21DRAFT_198527 [Apiosordaria backusii]